MQPQQAAFSIYGAVSTGIKALSLLHIVWLEHGHNILQQFPHEYLLGLEEMCTVNLFKAYMQAGLSAFAFSRFSKYIHLVTKHVCTLDAKD